MISDEATTTATSTAMVLHIPKDYVPTAESAHALYQINLAGFSGPLDLLYFLIRRHQIDIFDIPMAFICARYLECVQGIEELNLDVAAQFMYMASELLHIKSKLLLPKPQEPPDMAEEIDPRAELVARLLEYQKYRAAAAGLNALPWLDHEVFARSPEAKPAVVQEVALHEVSVFALVRALGGVLKRQTPQVRHQVMLEEVSVHRRMLSLVEVLNPQEPIAFADIFGPEFRRLDILVTFLAVLELTRMKLLALYESATQVLYLKTCFVSTQEAQAVLEGMTEPW